MPSKRIGNLLNTLTGDLSDNDYTIVDNLSDSESKKIGLLSLRSKMLQLLDNDLQTKDKTVIGAINETSSSLDIVDKTLFNVVELLKGHEYSIEQGTSPAYTQAVPAGSQKYAEVSVIGGSTIAWNQIATNEPPTSRAGVTITKNEADNSSTFNGTATENLSGNWWWGIGGDNNFKANRKYYIYIPIISGEFSGTCRFGGNAASLQCDFGSDKIVSISENQLSNIFGSSGTVFDNLTVRVFVVDLTKAFGSGNEPTTTTDESISAIRNYLESHPEYENGSIMIGKCDKVVSIGANLFDDNRLVSELSYTKNGDEYYGSNTRLHQVYGDGVPNLTFANNTQYTVSLDFKTSNTSCVGVVRIYHTDGSFVGASMNNAAYNNFSITSTAEKTVDKVVFTYGSGVATYYIKNLQIARGTSGAYKPYKPQITKEIPQAIRILDGYGWSAGTVYNYVDFENKKFHKRVSRVDLGSFNYTRGTSSSSGMTYYDSARITGKKNCATNHTPNDLMAKFVNTPNNNYPTSTNWNTFVSTTNIVTFYANGYSSSEEFKTAMSGQYLYYELANEEVIDISALLTDDNFIETEAGGTVKFHQQDDIQLELPNTVNYMVRLEDAI